MHKCALYKCYLNSKFCVINKVDKILLRTFVMTAAHANRDFHPSVNFGTTRSLLNTVNKTALVDLIS